MAVTHGKYTTTPNTRAGYRKVSNVADPTPEKRHTCQKGLLGSAYGCPVCMPDTAPEFVDVNDPERGLIPFLNGLLQEHTIVDHGDVGWETW
jgi:hypothetical protein